jgi:two-component system, cell cycle sensor histidine kinase and response regulator CckA
MSSKVEAKRSVLAKPYIRYSFAVAAVAVAFLLRLVLERSFGSNFPKFLIFYPAVMVVAIVAGLWPGVLATALASLVVDYWVLPPRGSFALASTADAVALTLFFGMGVLISMLAESNRRNQERLAAYKIELAVRQSEEQSETLANAIPQLCWMAKPDGWIFWYNQRWYEYTGTTPEQMQGWAWQSVHDPETLPKVLEQWNASIATGAPFDMVFPLRGADGVFRPFLTRVMPVKGAQGEVVRWFGTNTDITAQKQAEDDSKDSFVTLSNFVPQLVWICTPDGLNVYFNQRWVDYTGLTLEESYGRGWNTPFHPEDQQPAWNAWNNAVQTGGQYRIECRLRAADGSYRRFLIRGEPMRNISGSVLRWLGTCTDIEDLRQESEHLLRTVTENSRVGLVMLSKDRRYLYANAAYAEVLGLSTPDVVGKRVPDVMGHVYDQIGPRLDRAFAGERVAYELKVPVQQGAADDERSRFYAITYEPLRGHGEDGRVIVVVVDITERKHAEEALQSSQAKLQGIVGSAMDAIVSVDEQQRIVVFNRAAETVFQCAASEAIGSTLDRFLPKSLREAHHGHIRRFGSTMVTARSMNSPGILTAVRFNGEEFPIEATISQVQVGEKKLYTVILRDISERVAAEHTQHQLAAIVASSDDAIVGEGLDGVIQSWNPGAEQMYGYTPVEILAKPANILLPPNAEDEVAANVRRASEGVSTNYETIRMRKDGKEIKVALSVSPIRDSQGAVVGASTIARDITERWHLEQMLHQSQKMEAVGRLAGGVAHDFNNLLGVIIGYAYLVHASCFAGEEVRDAGQQIIRAAETGSALTRQLLAFGRKQVMLPKVIDLGEITAGLGKMIPRVLGEDVDVRVLRGEDLRRVTADPSQIEQIIMNLVVNARDAMPNGGKLIIETSNVHFDESEASHHDVLAGDYVLLAVTDTGQGMNDETRAHIFEPFFTTKEVGKGTGLGLATVYGIVSQSQGFIWVYSELGHGTTFKIYLPTTTTALAVTAALPVDRQELIVCGSETLLLVEDQAPLREMLTHILRSKGYTVLSAQGGPDALQQMAQYDGKVHLLLTDVIMPEMRGSVLAKALTGRYPTLLVVYMSGYTDNALIESDSLPENMVFLQKPFLPDLMLRVIREVLDKPVGKQWEEHCPF